MELLQPLGLIALISLPLIVALYFLRQRRPPRRVGSLMLWQKARQQVFRGRPWERFRPSWLLFLQILVATGIALALARPACIAPGTQTERLVIVLDGSASMGSTDVAPSRWAEAIARAEASIASSPENSEVALLVAGRLTRVAEPFTTDTTQLHATLERLRERGPDATSGSVKEALILAMQLRGEEGGRILLFSDGAFPSDALPPVAGSVDFIGVGERDGNLAITTFELRRAPSQRFGTTVVCVVQNTGTQAASGHLEIRLDGRPLEAHRVELAPGDSRAFGVPVASDQGRLTAVLEPFPAADGGPSDTLPTDNEAFAVLAPDLPVRVLLVGGNPLTARALAANPRLSVETIDAGSFTGEFTQDVVVFENTFPATIPQGRFLAIAPPDENPLVDYSGEELTSPAVAAWDRGHPVLHGLDLSGIRFGKVRRAVPQNNFVPLAEFAGNDGPVLLAGRTPAWRGVVLTVPLLETDLPLRVAFPVFLYNAIGWLSPGGEQNVGRTLATGQPLAIPARPGDALTVTMPGGEVVAHTVTAAESDGVYLYSDTSLPGFYDVSVTPQAGGEPLTFDFGVSLVDTLESNVAPRTTIALPRGGQLDAVHSVERVDDQGTGVLLGVFALLAIEWLFYLLRARRG